MYFDINKTFCSEVIITTTTRRGAGVTLDPIRIITQVYTKKGALIAEHDPSPDTFSTDDALRFARYAVAKGMSQPTRIDAMSWVVNGKPTC